MADVEWPIPIGSEIRVEDGQDLVRHVRGHVDSQIVVRFWVPWKKRWEYEVLSHTWFLVWYNAGRLWVKPPKKTTEEVQHVPT